MGCSSLIWIIVLVFDYSASLPVGPDIEARARLIKVWPPPKKFVIFWIPSVLQDLPSGMFAGAKIPSKSRVRTLIEMSFSLRTIDLDFSSGTFSTSGWMTLEWDDPRCWDICLRHLFNYLCEKQEKILPVLFRYRWEPSEYDNIVSVPLPFSKVYRQ